MRLKITHTTSYAYDQPVDYALQQVRLTPVSNAQQTVLDWEIEISGGRRELEFTDQHGNHTLLVSVESGQSAVSIKANGDIETTDTTGVLGPVYGKAPLWYFKRQTELTMPGKGIRKLAGLLEGNDNHLDNLHALSAAILNSAPYVTGETYSATSAEQALAGGSGVCQDHAQIFVSAARVANIPARYVSGYLMMDDRVDQDASHAWAEVHLDGLGWVGFDVSNGISPDARYVRVATGLDYREAAPISGMRLGAANESMIVSVQVQQ